MVTYVRVDDFPLLLLSRSGRLSAFLDIRPSRDFGFVGADIVMASPLVFWVSNINVSRKSSKLDFVDFALNDRVPDGRVGEPDFEPLGIRSSENGRRLSSIDSSRVASSPEAFCAPPCGILCSRASKVLVFPLMPSSATADAKFGTLRVFLKNFRRVELRDRDGVLCRSSLLGCGRLSELQESPKPEFIISAYLRRLARFLPDLNDLDDSTLSGDFRSRGDLRLRAC